MHRLSIRFVLLIATVASSGCAISRDQRTISLGLPAVSEGRWQAEKSCAQADANSSAMNNGQCDQWNSGTLQVEYGASRPVLDSVGWVVGIPRRVLLWDWRVDNHEVSDDTVTEVCRYLDENELNQVKVRINQYSPIDEMRRLRDNQTISPGWKYTFGMGNVLAYTIFPGRIWGGDSYNPYTQSLNVYSDVPSLALVEAAYAKDMAAQRYPGAYAASQSLPIIAMWHETRATDDVITYIAIRGTRSEQEETRKILFARYGMVLGGDIGSFQNGSGLAIGSVYQIVGAASGHAFAAYENATR
jgi:hypothetical protein